MSSDVIEWKTQDASGAGSFGVVTCRGPFLGAFVKGTISLVPDAQGGRALFRIEIFSLTSGGWIPFIESYKDFSHLEALFKSLSLRANGLKIDSTNA